MTSVDHPAADMPPNPAADSGAKPWPRAAFMVLFAILASLAQSVLTLVAVLQFLWLLFAKTPNPILQRFGVALGMWFAEIARYQACDSETRPFPFADWPTPAR